MYRYIEGQLAFKDINGVVIDVNSMGYELAVPVNSFVYSKNIGDIVRLYTHMAVKEDDISLYGFDDYETLSLFKKLISINGIGVKAAIGILSLGDVNSIKTAIASEDTSYITKASGIGAKTAKRLILELKDVFSEFENPDISNNDINNSIETDEVLDALMSLGYTLPEVKKIMSQTSRDGLDVEGYIKKCLKRL